jgi:hypothetical protein
VFGFSTNLPGDTGRAGSSHGGISLKYEPEAKTE